MRLVKGEVEVPDHVMETDHDLVEKADKSVKEEAIDLKEHKPAVDEVSIFGSSLPISINLCSSPNFSCPAMPPPSFLFSPRPHRLMTRN